MDCALGFPYLRCSLNRQLLAQLLVTHICNTGSLHAWQPDGQMMAALAMPCSLLKANCYVCAQSEPSSSIEEFQMATRSGGP